MLIVRSSEEIDMSSNIPTLPYLEEAKFHETKRVETLLNELKEIEKKRKQNIKSKHVLILHGKVFSQIHVLQ